MDVSFSNSATLFFNLFPNMQRWFGNSYLNLYVRSKRFRIQVHVVYTQNIQFNEDVYQIHLRVLGSSNVYVLPVHHVRYA